jgi:hypothetical protein
VKVEENRELPWDVLDIISKTLDLDDHFQFAGVCKNWRAFHKIYWRNFLASQEPLLLQVSHFGRGSFSFINIPDQKVYCLNTLECSLDPYYVTSSSGYFITVDSNKSFVLIDPFTRIKKVTNPFTFDFSPLGYHALLAFGKCSDDEFVLVVFRKWTTNLHVYQSRNCGWVTYSTMGNLDKVIDFVVFHDIIYVLTDWANIGMLSLNSANIKFLKLNNSTDVMCPLSLKLVNCDEQLLVVNFSEKMYLDVYKVDFSTMNYVKLETLGDIALFYALDRHCYSLSKPNMWGYESNSLYATNTYSTKYSGDDKKLEKHFTLPAHLRTSHVTHDWYFRHIKYEVDSHLRTSHVTHDWYFRHIVHCYLWPLCFHLFPLFACE